MRKAHRTALLPYSAQQMFDLVNDVNAYPQFLPWCRSAQMKTLSAVEMEATLDLALKGLHKSFTTRNRLVPGREIHVSLVRGPFRTMNGHWLFQDLDSASDSPREIHGCRVSLELNFALAGRILELTVGPLMERVGDSLVDLFSERARKVYGRPSSSIDSENSDVG
ncbi:MAG: type II toxin-antitoxin system RatA family toxin [Immundisolibacteraceae bacterium]|nr:type II toxin-antitoxin system RatA family toxin [Immundisolibacteraceae bacterium]